MVDKVGRGGSPWNAVNMQSSGGGQPAQLGISVPVQAQPHGDLGGGRVSKSAPQIPTDMAEIVARAQRGGI